MYSTDTTQWRFCPQMGPQIIQIVRPWVSNLEPMVTWGSISGHPYMIEHEENHPIYCVLISVISFKWYFGFVSWGKRRYTPKFWPPTKKNMIGSSQIWDDAERNLWLQHQRDANNQNRTWWCHVFFIPNMTCFSRFLYLSRGGSNMIKSCLWGSSIISSGPKKTSFQSAWWFLYTDYTAALYA